MNRTIGSLVSIWAVAAVLGSLLLAGCGGGGPRYVDPVGEIGPCEPAEEFTYLADLPGGALSLCEDISEARKGMNEDAAAATSQIQTLLYGVTAMERDEIKAEASERMVHACAEYHIPRGVDNPLVCLCGAGRSEVRLPARFPSDRWIGHLFVANPGRMIQKAIESFEEQAEKLQEELEKAGLGGMGGLSDLFSVDSMARMYGLEKAEDFYDWMGDELVFFTLANPEFVPDSAEEEDSDAEPGADEGEEEPATQQWPSYTLLALATPNPEKGMDVYEAVIKVPMHLAGKGEKIRRDEIMGYEALILDVDPEENPFMAGLDEEQLEVIKAAGPSCLAAVPGYLFIGNKVSLEAALEVFEPSARGTGRLTTVEAECNWDRMREYSMGKESSPSVIAGGPIPEVDEFLSSIREATAGINELGTSRYSLAVWTTGRMDLDVVTSRDSVRFYEAVSEVMEEKGDRMWKAVGRRFGEMMKEAMTPPDMGSLEGFNFPGM